jgi:hypothetical protein
MMMRGVLGSLGVQRVSLVSMAIVFAFVFAVLLGNSFFFLPLSLSCRVVEYKWCENELRWMVLNFLCTSFVLVIVNLQLDTLCNFACSFCF